MKKKKQQETEKFVSTEIKQNKMANEDYQKIKAFFVVLIIVIALVGLLFLFNGKVVTKDVFNEGEKTTTTEPSYDENIILASDIFKKGDKEYMVLLFDSSNKENGMLYSGLINSYNGKGTIYGVDFANKMNKAHFNEGIENENTNPTTLEELVVGGPRLLIIKDKKVVEYIKEPETITETLRAK